MSRLRKLQPKQKLSYNVLLSTIRLSYLFVLRARLYPISHVTMLASIPFAPRIPHSPLPNTQAMLLIGIYALPCIHCVKTAASVCKANCIDYHGHTAACSSLTRLTVFVPFTNSYACHVHTCSTSDQGVPLFLIIGHRQICVTFGGYRVWERSRRAMNCPDRTPTRDSLRLSKDSASLVGQNVVVLSSTSHYQVLRAR